MILEGSGGACNIICTQPRRISAVGVSERVAEERDEKLGDLVGYSIRLDSKVSAATRLLYCTTGVLLRILESEKTLEGVTHVIVDEVHERSVESDFVLVVLKGLIKKRKDLKLILMSATMNAELFSKYFDNCPLLDIPGRTFPVKNLFLEDAIEFCKYKCEMKSPYVRPKSKNKKNNPSESLTKKEEEKIETLYSNYSKETRQCLKVMDENKLNYDLIVEIIKQIVKHQEQFWFSSPECKKSQSSTGLL
jgi:HrpA-like RNA helicase